jgi:membrane associated rhomboid family serine protease
MLEDRQYMRRPPEDSREIQWSATLVLLVVTAVSYLFQISFEHDPATKTEMQKYVYLSREGIQNGYLWQLLSFQFLHGNVIHLLVNLLGIYLVGRELEGALGKASFLKLYFGTGVAGGILHVVCALVWRKYFDVPVIGASAGACGLMGAFAALYWGKSIHLVFVGLPVTITGRGFLWVTVVLSAVGGIALGEDVAHAAHAGGLIGGLYYVFGVLHGNPWGAWGASQQPARRPRVLVRAAARQEAWEQPEPPEPAVEEDLPPHEFIAREVDPILDKINAQGIKSLTERELKILEKARAKMKK